MCLPSSQEILVSVSLSALCTFLPCPPTSLNSLTSAVDHLESIHHNGLKIFSCVLVFGSGQLAVQLLPHICLSVLSCPHWDKPALAHLPGDLSTSQMQLDVVPVANKTVRSSYTVCRGTLQ